MFLFYISDIESEIITLPEEESKHCIRVLRLREKDKIRLTDGKGNLYEGSLLKANIKGCEVKVKHLEKKTERSNYKLHIAIAPTKNINRFEWFLEKSTEIGIDIITPIICEHSERKSINLERTNRIIISALKQSNIVHLPVLNELISFNVLIQNLLLSSQNFNRYIAVCDNAITKPFKEVYSKGSNALILIGPEGDFSKKEIDSAIISGFIPINLSPNRLRTETAAIIACTTINYLND